MFSKLQLLFNTIKHLRFIQIYYRLYYKIKSILPISNEGSVSCEKISYGQFPIYLYNRNSYIADNTFVFINLHHTFGKIDWNFAEKGRLWTYNLNYFDFVNQQDINSHKALDLIYDFIANYKILKDGKEPYPTSIRIINIIKFVLRNNIKNDLVNDLIAKDVFRLTKNIEYHLLGNHLLENGFALLWGAYYFNHEGLYKQAKKILIKELNEQILQDGGHFEQTPMYHNLMTYRVLDCYNLVVNNDLFDKELSGFLKNKAEKILSFSKQMIFDNGDIPLVNDSAFGIAPTTEQLLTYGDKLKLNVESISLSDSGYRFLENGNIELFFDIGNIVANYQPGHIHADIFSFELHINKRPVIVDTGTSTYEVNVTRFYERSTMAHNTVSVNKSNSIQVWAGHRVGKRPNVKILKDGPCEIVASHNGFVDLYKTIHTRSVEIDATEVAIKDDIQASKGEAYFHFAPNEFIEIKEKFIIGRDFMIIFENAISIVKSESYCARQFNKKEIIDKVTVSFESKLISKIRII